MDDLLRTDANSPASPDHQGAGRRCLLLRQTWALLVAGFVLGRFFTGSAVAPASAEPPEAPAQKAAADKLGTDWVRLQVDGNGKLLGMQTAIVRYVPAKPDAAPVEVDLVGAIHVADDAYYGELNRRFEKYDSLLYELVAPDGTIIPRGRGTSNAHPLGAMQNGMKNMLELEHQLEKIDYTRPNFVHADLSPKQVQQAMQQRGEGFVQMYFHVLGESMAAQSAMAAKGESLDIDVFSALFAEDRARRLKTALAKQLAEVETVLVGFGGENGSVLITERNRAALRVLRKELDSGKRHVGVFYGAGHLTDMDKRLRQEFGLKPVEITWLTAWELADPQ